MVDSREAVRDEQQRRIELLRRLTDRELQVLHLLGTATSHRDIAAQLWISSNTVLFHVRNIHEKLEIASIPRTARQREIGYFCTALSVSNREGEPPLSGSDEETALREAATPNGYVVRESTAAEGSTASAPVATLQVALRDSVERESQHGSAKSPRAREMVLGRVRWFALAGVSAILAVITLWSTWGFHRTVAPPGLAGNAFVSPPDGATIYADSDITFAWNQVDRADEYVIEFWGGDYEGTLKSNWIRATTFNIGQMHPGHSYFWRVKARNGSGESEWSPALSFTISTTGPPPDASGCQGAPTLRSPENGVVVVRGTLVAFTWVPPVNCVPDGYTFRLNRSPDAESPSPLVDTGVGHAERQTSYSFNFQESGVYYWHVRPCRPCTPFQPGSWAWRRVEVTNFRP